MLLKENEKVVAVVTFSLFLIVGLIGFKNIEKIDFTQIDAVVVLNDALNNKYEKFYEEYNLAFSELLDNRGNKVASIHYPNEAEKPKHLAYFGDLEQYGFFFNIETIKRAIH